LLLRIIQILIRVVSRTGRGPPGGIPANHRVQLVLEWATTEHCNPILSSRSQVVKWSLRKYSMSGLHPRPGNRRSRNRWLDCRRRFYHQYTAPRWRPWKYRALNEIPIWRPSYQSVQKAPKNWEDIATIDGHGLSMSHTAGGQRNYNDQSYRQKVVYRAWQTIEYVSIPELMFCKTVRMVDST